MPIHMHREITRAVWHTFIPLIMDFPEWHIDVMLVIIAVRGVVPYACLFIEFCCVCWERCRVLSKAVACSLCSTNVSPTLAPFMMQSFKTAAFFFLILSPVTTTVCSCRYHLSAIIGDKNNTLATITIQEDHCMHCYMLCYTHYMLFFHHSHKKA